MAALSPAAPTRPIEPTMWCRLSWPTSFLDRNCDPRSVWSTQPATPAPSARRRATALFNAATANEDLIRESMAYPTIRLE